MNASYHAIDASMSATRSAMCVQRGVAGRRSWTGMLVSGAPTGGDARSTIGRWPASLVRHVDRRGSTHIERRSADRRTVPTMSLAVVPITATLNRNWVMTATRAASVRAVMSP